MPKVVRVGDKVNMNCPHGAMGTVTSGSSNIVLNDKELARQGDTVVCDVCGVSRSIDSGSPNADGNNMQVARVGDPSTGTCDPGFICCPHTTVATLATGSDNCDLND